MSAVVDFVSDAVGGIVEAVGDVVEGVGDALSDVGDWIGENIIEPIKDDPLTFIASAVAYAYGIPGLSFAGAGTAASVGIATTGSKMLQGEDFDDALKAGALAFAGTGVTNAIGKGISTGGKDWSPNLYTSADDLAAASLTKSATSSATTKPGATSGADLMPESQLATGQIDDQTLQDLIAKVDEMPAYDKSLYPEYQDIAALGDDTPLVKKDSSLMPDADNAISQQQPSSTTPEAGARKPTTGGYETAKIYQPSADIDIPAQRNIPADAIRVNAQPGDPGWVPPIEEGMPKPVVRLDQAGNILPDAPPSTTWQGIKNLGSAALETAGNWVWDGAKWVWNNPELALAGMAGASYLLGDKGGPPDQSGSGKDADRQVLDQQFYSDLDQLVLDRQKRDGMFGRDENPYLSGLYTYAEKGPEHEFFTPTIYTPASEYSSSKPVNAAQGGSIGALNAQLPSYYRYGQMPMNMAQGGYASGGLRSVQEDGRSDHIPAMLSDGEFVVDAETVALLGNGSNKAGANRLEQMRKDVRRQKGGALSKGQFSPNAKSPLPYMKRR